ASSDEIHGNWSSLNAKTGTAAAAAAGDRISIEIIQDSGRMIGEALAGLVNFYNPRLILIGGGVSKIGFQFLSSIRQAVLNRSTSLSTRDLHIGYS
ncbi:MAG: ROK family protein, partial [Chloroflexi bacterium]|nr:ROK family protein [Chloroflexota bacterium]